MLKTVIFDIDGTLWHTGTSYVYAYHKLCDHYGVMERKSNDEIKACLGIKIDQVLRYLFPQVEDQGKLAFQAMNYSIEYLMAHAGECCFDGVTELLRQVSGDYDVYLVSNCLKGYAQAFVQISDTADYIKAIYTIEDGEKAENIKKIAKETDGKLLFVGDSTDDYMALSDRYTQYFCYAKYGYKPCEQYEYAIEAPMELKAVLARIALKERQSGGTPYRVFSRGDNQITLIPKGKDHSYFGFVKCADENFDAVVKELLAGSTGKLIGPIDFNTYYPYRFALDHYDLKLYPDLPGEKELPFFLKNGFRLHQEYVSVLAQMDCDACQRFAKVMLPREYCVRQWHGEEVYAHLDDIFAVASSAFAQAYLYESIERQEFMDIYVTALRQINPDLVVIYHREEPIAFCFCYEDPEKRFYVCKTIGMKKDERSSKVVFTLIYRAYEMMRKKGYTDILYHFRRRNAEKTFGLLSKRNLCTKKYALLEYDRDQ